MARTHYQVLGVRRSATVAEVRRAYRERASQLHPDRWIDGSPAERATSARAMSEVNEAWRVLSDPSSRARYDRSLVPGVSRPAPAHGESSRGDGNVGAGSVGDDGDEQFAEPLLDPLVRLLRALPWLVLLGLLAAIFVFTAYARA